MKKLRRAYEAAYGHPPPSHLAPDDLASIFLEDIWGGTAVPRELQLAALNEIRRNFFGYFSMVLSQWADDMAYADRVTQAAN